MDAATGALMIFAPEITAKRYYGYKVAKKFFESKEDYENRLAWNYFGFKLLGLL